MTAMTVAVRWNGTPMQMFWKWLNDHLAYITVPIAMVFAAYFTTRYSVLNKIVDQTENLRKSSEAAVNANQARIDKLEDAVHQLRSEVLTAREDVMTVRRENTELIRENHRLQAELTEVSGKYDALMVSHDKLQGEHDALRRQMFILNPSIGESIGV